MKSARERNSVRAVALVCLSTAVSCSSPTQSFCIGQRALAVAIVDLVTNAPSASGAILVARTGTTVDTSRVGPSNDAEEVTAGDTAGTYDVTVIKSGYRDWTINDVRVIAGQCGEPSTVHLVAKLVRTP
jgi:hypothetical protein